LVIAPFREVEIQKARQNFEKFWGIINVVRYAIEYCRHLEAITLVSGAASDKRGAPTTYLAVNSSAVHVLTESLAVEIAPIRINVVSPGVTDTPLYGEDRSGLLEFVQRDPLKRVATPQEIAEAIYF